MTYEFILIPMIVITIERNITIRVLTYSTSKIPLICELIISMMMALNIKIPPPNARDRVFFHCGSIKFIPKYIKKRKKAVDNNPDIKKRSPSIFSIQHLNILKSTIDPTQIFLYFLKDVLSR